MNHVNNDAERKILCTLYNKPHLIFDIEAGLKEDNFYTAVARNIFGAIKQIASTGVDIINSSSIDPVILEEKIASIYPEYYKSQVDIVKQAIVKIASETAPSDKDFKECIRIVLSNSIKRNFEKKIDILRDEVSLIDSPDKLAGHIECSTLEFTKDIFRSSDIEIMGSNFSNWLVDKYNQVKEGRVYIGMKVGFPNFERCIGGGLRDGTITVVAARSKMGKSFLALNMADNVAKEGYPVLYLDSELDDEYQTIRRVSKMTGIPLYQLEEGRFIGDTARENLAKNAVFEMERNKLYYVDIKGWTIEQQISIIRRFFAKIVGKGKDGSFNKALIILDYLKLMSAADKKGDKEWEALGYRMTALHDLMSEYKAPMLAFAQQNRDGLEKEDESTISGSDRIIWLCDTFAIFSKLDEVQMASQDPNASNSNIKPANCKLKVVDCRQGPGTPGRSFIGVYADIHDHTLKMDEVCGIIEERAKMIENITK